MTQSDKFDMISFYYIYIVQIEKKKKKNRIQNFSLNNSYIIYPYDLELQCLHIANHQFKLYIFFFKFLF